MKIIACYCRVSTKKTEQLESLENQIEYFNNLMEIKPEYKLHEIYYDEGISAKQMKNRKDFLRMMEDAKRGLFDTIMVKDITRFSRNTVDFLTSIRELRQMGINVIFVSYGQETLKEETELNLTMQIAFAQEESARLSKKVKWGKNINAKKGRVPNFVFGYDKIDLFTLRPNPEESKIVEKIFDLYVNEGVGTPSIAQWLTQNKIKTKKNKQTGWTQKVVLSILTNSIYIGKVINKKSEVIDFIQGTRKLLEINPDYIVDRPDFRIISDELFNKAQDIIAERRELLGNFHNKQSNKYLFSNLIKCSECGYSFRRVQRMYTKLYKWWVCGNRNSKGIDACLNTTRIEEEDLIDDIKYFFEILISDKKDSAKSIANIIIKNVEDNKPKDHLSKEDMTRKIDRLSANKEKYMDMYKNDLISMDELKSYITPLNEEINTFRAKLIDHDNTYFIDEKSLVKYVEKYLVEIEKYLDDMTNQKLKRVIDRIEVKPSGEKVIYLKLESNGKLITKLPMNMLEINPTHLVTSFHKDVTIWSDIILKIS